MNKVYLGVLVCLVAVAIAGGFLVAGGPGYARMEQEDRARSGHLRELGWHYACTLVETGAMPEGCVGQAQPPRAPKPTQADQYELVVSGGTAFELCTTFKTDSLETGGSYGRGIYFEGRRGCIRYTRNTPQDSWIKQ